MIQLQATPGQDLPMVMAQRAIMDMMVTTEIAETTEQTWEAIAVDTMEDPISAPPTSNHAMERIARHRRRTPSLRVVTRILR